MPLVDILILACATWYTSNSLATKTGPWKIFLRIRSTFYLGGLLECPHCLSIWVAVLLLVLYGIGLQIIVVSLCIAGAAQMLGTYSGAAYVDNNINSNHT